MTKFSLMQEVDPEKGTWQDVADFADHFDVTMELMVNHISPASAEFQDYLQHGDKSQFADMFIDWDQFWPGGETPSKMYAAPCCASMCVCGSVYSL